VSPNVHEVPNVTKSEASGKQFAHAYMAALSVKLKKRDLAIPTGGRAVDAQAGSSETIQTKSLLKDCGVSSESLMAAECEHHNSQKDELHELQKAYAQRYANMAPHMRPLLIRMRKLACTSPDAGADAALEEAAHNEKDEEQGTHKSNKDLHSTAAGFQWRVPGIAGASQYFSRKGSQAQAEGGQQPTSAQDAAQQLRKQAGNLLHMGSSETSDVTVVVRVRPLLVHELHASNKIQAVVTRGATIALRNMPPDHAENEGPLKMLSKQVDFTFDAVISETCSTQRAFELTGAKAVEEVVRGVTSVVFAYGQTGSGKTYTLLGETVYESGREGPTNEHSKSVPQLDNLSTSISIKTIGVASMTFDMLQQKLKARASEEQYCIHVSAVQIYLNQVHDLLSQSLDKNVLHMRTHTKQATLRHLGGEVCELHPKETYVACSSTQEFQKLLLLVIASRMQGSTHMTSTSSRSHLILTLEVRCCVQHDQSDDAQGMASREHIMRKLFLVDLAGNERDAARRGILHETRLRAEGIDINLSLSALTSCLRERAKTSALERKNKSLKVGEDHSAVNMQGVDPKQEAYPPSSTSSGDIARKHSRGGGAGTYRTSALTRLLKEPLACAKIFFLACCSPVASSLIATRQTLTYAAMVKVIKTSAEDSALLLQHGMDIFPISFLPLDALLKRGQIPRSNEPLTVHLNELRVSVLRVMVSHRWLSPSADPRVAHPDTIDHPKHSLLAVLFQRLGESGWIQSYDCLSVVSWIDFGVLRRA
jgi:hypothetical protein